jgi:hypothetical protein
MFQALVRRTQTARIAATPGEKAMFGKTIRDLALAMVCCALLPAAAQAQAALSAQSAKPAKAYYDVYDAMIGGMDLAAMTDTAADSIFDGLVRNEPSFSALAKGKPQLRDRFRTIARPYLRIWLERSTTVRRDQIAQNLSTKLTLAEAREIADFYGSPLGQKILAAITRNLSLDATVDTTIAGKNGFSDSKARATDENQTMNKAMQQLLPTLTPEEQGQILKYGRSKTFAKLPLVSKAFDEIPQPTIDEISTAEEREGFKKELTGFFAEIMKER